MRPTGWQGEGGGTEGGQPEGEKRREAIGRAGPITVPESPVGGRVPVRQQAAGAAHAQWMLWRLARSLRPRPGFGGALGGWVAARGLRGAARRCSREVTSRGRGERARVPVPAQPLLPARAWRAVDG